MTPRTKNLLQVNLAVLMWGGTAMFGKGIELPVHQLICLRALLGAAALLPFLLLRRNVIMPRSPRHYGLMFTLGALLCLHWITYFQALKVSTAAVAILALCTYPAITAIIEPFLFRERLHKLDVVLAVCVLGGVFVMTPEINLSNSTTQGILLGFGSGIFYMIRNLMIRRYVREYSSSTLMFWQMLVTGLLLMPLLGLSPVEACTPTTWGLLVLLAIAFTAIPQTLFAAGFEHLTAKTVGILATLLPLYGATLGYFVHDETITARTAIGGLVILSCVILENVRSYRA